MEIILIVFPGQEFGIHLVRRSQNTSGLVSNAFFGGNYAIWPFQPHFWAYLILSPLWWHEKCGEYLVCIFTCSTMVFRGCIKFLRLGIDTGKSTNQNCTSGFPNEGKLLVAASRFRKFLFKKNSDNQCLYVDFTGAREPKHNSNIVGTHIIASAEAISDGDFFCHDL